MRVMQTAENRVPLAELAASLEISVDTIASQKQEIKCLSEQVNALKKIGMQAASVRTFPGGTTICTHFEVVGRTAPHRKNACYFDPQKLQTEKNGRGKLWMKKAWRARMMNDDGGQRKQ